MRLNHPKAKIIASALAATAILQTTSCAIPAPPPAAEPAIAEPSPPPSSAPLPGQDSDQAWSDAPITPGVWRWSMEGGRSVANFADGLLMVRCDSAAAGVTLLRAGGQPDVEGHVPMTILTEKSSAALTGTFLAGPPAAIALRFSAQDPLLDAMAFSRGRFAVEAAGLPPLLVPSWPEISRVIEDCR